MPVTTTAKTAAPKLPKKHDYFQVGVDLCYVIDILEDHYLIENCKSLDQTWIRDDIFARIKKVVVKKA